MEKKHQSGRVRGVSSFFKRKDKMPCETPQPAAVLPAAQKCGQLAPYESSDRKRTIERYVEASRFLEQTVKGQAGRWSAFDFPELKGEPATFNDSQFKESINMALESHKEAVGDETAWEKCKCVVQCVFNGLAPLAKNLLIIAKEGSAVCKLPLYIV
jgi:hypothetical protein